MNKTVIGIIIVVIFIGGIIYLVTRGSSMSNVGLNSAEQNQSTLAQGRVVFSVTDAAVNMSTISEINMKVNSVAIHNNDEGWVTVSSTPRTYSLLALNAKNTSELLAEVDANAGTYDQVRLVIDSISVKTKAGATKEAKLPSGELKINTKLVVTADKTSSVNFDFLADKSLHTTGSGEYVFAPVIKTETKSNADVKVDSANVVTIDGGSVDNSSSSGMDLDGSVKANFQIKSDEKLDIEGGVVIPHAFATDVLSASSIKIKGSAFSPATLTVKVGQKVTWINDDVVPHTVTSDSGGLLDSGVLAPGGLFSFTFTKAGTVNYHCSVHPSMKAKIIVQ